MSKLFVVLGSGLAVAIGSTRLQAGYVYNGYHDADSVLVSPVPDSTGINGFGISVALKNGLALVGAHREGGSGQAHIYNSQTGSLIHTFAPATGSNAGYFGRHVALGEAHAAVSSTKGTYIYSLSNFELLHILPHSPTTLPGSQGLDIDLGRLAIATRGDGGYVFDLERGEVVAYHPRRAGAVALSEDYFIIGNSREGLVSVRDWTTDTQLFTLQPEGNPEDTSFGTTISADNGRLVVGDSSASRGSSYSAGKAYVFDLADGELIHELEGSDTARLSLFGTDTAVEGNTAIISAYRHSDTFLLRGDTRESRQSYQGAAYAFDLNTGVELRRFTTLGPETGGWANYGFSVDYDGEQIIAGTLGWPKKAYLTSFQIPEPTSWGCVLTACGCLSWKSRMRAFFAGQHAA